MTPLDPVVADLAASVPAPDAEAAARTRDRWATLAAPPGALGRLEELACDLSGSTGRCPPDVPGSPAVVVCAGDHGVHGQDVTAWPQGVTAAMVDALGRGGAAVNALAEVTGASVHVLDVGVATAVPDRPGLHRARVRAGTRDLRVADAMTRAECVRALRAGVDLVDRLLASGTDLMVTGDMGIANTTAAAALIAACTGTPAADVTGRGAGIDDRGLAHKATVVADALDRARPDPVGDPIGVLAALGGLEHAALVGVLLAGGAARVPVVLDGVNADAAALVACALAPHLAGHLVAGHVSAEPGAQLALAHLGLEPVLDLGLRLGEGTGALLAVPVLQSAAAACGRMAALTDLDVP